LTLNDAFPGDDSDDELTPMTEEETVYGERVEFRRQNGNSRNMQHFRLSAKSWSEKNRILN